MSIRHPNCEGCPLAAKAKVWGVGPLTARILLVGEGPGPREEAEGVPFVGPMGWRINALLGANGLTRAEVRIENVIQCKEMPKSATGRRAIEHCGPSLHEVIAAMPHLELIIAFGDAALAEVSCARALHVERRAVEQANKRAERTYQVALRRRGRQLAKHPEQLERWQKKYVAWQARRIRALAKPQLKSSAKALAAVVPAAPPPPVLPLPPQPQALPPVQGWDSVTVWRGSPLHLPLVGREVLLVPIIHPATSFGHRQPKLWPLICLDFRKAIKLWRGAERVPHVHVRIIRTGLDLLDWFGVTPAGLIGLDIEWSRRADQLLCIGIGGPGDCYAIIPFLEHDRASLEPRERFDILRILQQEFDSSQRQWGGHFAAGYDERKLGEVGLRLRCTWDSLYGFHVCFSELGSPRDEESEVDDFSQAIGYDLGFVSTVLTSLPYSKDVWGVQKDGSRVDDALDMPDERRHEYCAGDVARSYHAQLVIEREFDRNFAHPEQGRTLMHREMEQARRASAMTLLGVPILDVARCERLARYEEWRAAAEERARQVMGDLKFKISSTMQLARALEARGVRGIRWNHTTNKPKLDGRVLDRLAVRYPHEELFQIVQLYRRAEKECVAYEQMQPASHDGRAHPSWKVHGTVGARWSSTPNFQNLSHEQREVIG